MARNELGSEQPVKFTLVHFVVSVLGNILPLIVAMLYYATVGTSTADLNKVVYGDGQFYLYSATFLTTAGFIFFAYSAEITDRYFLGGLLVGSILLVVANLYAWKISVSTFGDNVLFWTSAVSFVASIPLYYWALRLSHRHSDPSRFKYRRLLDAKKAQDRMIRETREALAPETKQKEIDDLADDLPEK